MDSVAALPFIPQRPPIVMVDNILSCNPEVVVTNFTIKSDNLFVINDLFSEYGLMENVAQTCAARIGWLNQDKKVRIGVIGAINNFEVLRFPAIGETLQTTVAVDSEVFDAIIVKAKTECAGELVSQCSMKVFVIEE